MIDEKLKDSLIQDFKSVTGLGLPSDMEALLKKRFDETIGAYLKAENLHEQAAELHSLKQSILESGLKNYFPVREMSFHDKVVFAIDAATRAKEIPKDDKPLKFDELPKWLQEELFKRHSHAEIQNDISPSTIVYPEVAVLSLIKIIGVPDLKEKLVKFGKWYQLDEMQRENKELWSSIVDRYLKEENLSTN